MVLILTASEHHFFKVFLHFIHSFIHTQANKHTYKIYQPVVALVDKLLRFLGYFFLQWTGKSQKREKKIECFHLYFYWYNWVVSFVVVSDVKLLLLLQQSCMHIIVLYEKVVIKNKSEDRQTAETSIHNHQGKYTLAYIMCMSVWVFVLVCFVYLVDFIFTWMNGMMPLCL